VSRNTHVQTHTLSLARTIAQHTPTGRSGRNADEPEEVAASRLGIGITPPRSELPRPWHSRIMSYHERRSASLMLPTLMLSVLPSDESENE